MGVVPIFDDIDETDEWSHDAELECRAFEKTLCTNDKAHAQIDDLRERVAVLERERDEAAHRADHAENEAMGQRSMLHAAIARAEEAERSLASVTVENDSLHELADHRRNKGIHVDRKIRESLSAAVERLTRERDRLADACACALGNLDHLVETWGSEGITRTVQDKLRKALTPEAP